MDTVWVILQVLCTIPFWFPFLLYVIFILKGSGKKDLSESPSPSSVAVIVTAYKQIELVSDAVHSILNSGYRNFTVYVVADACDISALRFSDDRVVVLRPETELASNTKSHFYAINNFRQEHDIITIIDSDNLVDTGYIGKIVAAIDKGYVAVQGVRKARNLDTVYACLDEAGDILYRFIDRKLLFEAGSSASLAGSGMAFKKAVYIDALKDFKKEGAGFDKFLQYELVRKNKRIAFIDDAMVLDAKTSKSDQLVKQRARWINTWFKYWVLAIKLLFKSVVGLNWNQFAFSMMLLRPPLFLLGFFSGVMLIINCIVSPYLLIVWGVSFLCFVFVYIHALRFFRAEKAIYRSLIQAPRFIYFQVKALFRSRIANKISVATTHEIADQNKEKTI